MLRFFTDIFLLAITCPAPNVCVGISPTKKGLELNGAIVCIAAMVGNTNRNTYISGSKNGSLVYLNNKLSGGVIIKSGTSKVGINIDPAEVFELKQTGGFGLALINLNFAFRQFLVRALSTKITYHLYSNELGYPSLFDPYMMNYEAFCQLAIKAIQEQQQKISGPESNVEILQERIESAESALNISS